MTSYIYIYIYIYMIPTILSSHSSVSKFKTFRCKFKIKNFPQTECVTREDVKRMLSDEASRQLN